MIALKIKISFSRKYLTFSFIIIKDGGNDEKEEGEDNYALEDLADDTGDDNESTDLNTLGSFTFNRKERLDVKKPGPFYPNSENNFFIKKVRNTTIFNYQMRI